MARKTGSTGGTVDFTAFFAEQAARNARLKDLAKEQAALTKQADRLNAVNAEIAALMGGTASVAPRQTAKAKTDTKKGDGTKGRKGKKDTATGNGTSGISTRDALLQVLPNNDADGMTKQDAVTAIQKLGWSSTASNPSVVVGQTLGKFKDFLNPERGKWRLSAAGMKARDKANAPAAAETPAESAPETPTAPAAAPATEGAAAPVTA